MIAQSQFDKDVVLGHEGAMHLSAELPEIENDATFTHFNLYSASTLSRMTKRELVEYIHMIYHNWSVENACRVRLGQIINEMESER
ncbi:MAG TPA: hypothetical protein IAD15_09145 [Candidatus Fimiplasma intestinipullorum]|uniref:Uncharacterized protein n=1 Tax=Candidatus Fimiplasma intestinipullorum TaxID=2840825 RepID=A0A9D1HRL6_9FIRM|nr:hypothetical protein [Candidatus Fimiplasma intestinipullorum]